MEGIVLVGELSLSNVGIIVAHLLLLGDEPIIKSEVQFK